MWYEFALHVQPESDDAHFGIALCSLKDGEPIKASKHIDEAMRIAKCEDTYIEEKAHLTYIKSLCLKILKQHK